MSEAPLPGSIPAWTVGDRMGKALAHAGVSVGEMAEYLDIHRNTISAYINDRRSVPRQTLLLWAMRTNVPLAWLQEGVGAPSNPTPPGGGQEQTELEKLAATKRGGSSRSRRSGADYPSVSQPFPTAA